MRGMFHSGVGGGGGARNNAKSLSHNLMENKEFRFEGFI